jgi:four helix bundle protein
MNELQWMTKRLAIEVIRFVETLNRNSLPQAVIGRQLIRSGTSVGANYRAAIRSKSTADFISKMGTVEEEADESMYWLELLVETGTVKSEQTIKLKDFANQIVAMTVKSIKTSRSSRSS